MADTNAGSQQLTVNNIACNTSDDTSIQVGSINTKDTNENDKKLLHKNSRPENMIENMTPEEVAQIINETTGLSPIAGLDINSEDQIEAIPIKGGDEVIDGQEITANSDKGPLIESPSEVSENSKSNSEKYIEDNSVPRTADKEVVDLKDFLSTMVPSKKMDGKICIPVMEVLGIKIKSPHSISEMKSMLKAGKANTKEKIVFPVLHDIFGHEKVRKCGTVYTCNWPTWIEPHHVFTFLKLLTGMKVDSSSTFLNTTKDLYYIEILTYTDKSKRQGAFLIHFCDYKTCYEKYKLLRQVAYFNPDIQVLLDIDNAVSQTVCQTDYRLSKQQWLNPDLEPHQRICIVPTTTEAPPNYIQHQLPEPIILEENEAHTQSENLTLTQTKTKERPKEFIDRRIVTPVLTVLGVEYLAGKHTEAIRSELASLKAEKTPILFTDPFCTEPKHKVASCKTICVRNLPTWFEKHHIQVLLKLLTDIYRNTGENYKKYHVELLTYSEKSKKQGAFLMHFNQFKCCYKVFKKLRDIQYFNSKIEVILDIENKISDINRGRSVPGPQWHLLEGSSQFSTLTSVLKPPPDYTPDPLSQVFYIKTDENLNVIEKAVTSQPIDTANVRTDILQNVNGSENMELNAQDSDENDCHIIEREIEVIDLATDDLNVDNECIMKSHEIVLKNERDDEYDDQHSECKIVHVKNLPRVKYTTIKDILKNRTPFDTSRKRFSVRMVDDWDKMSTIKECCLVFDSHEDAAAVNKALNGLFTHGKQLEASLLCNTKEPSNKQPCDQTSKRKRDKDSNGPTENAKRPKLDSFWETVTETFSHAPNMEIGFKTYGIDKNLLVDLGLWNKSLSNVVVVTNLVENVRVSKLSEVFSLAGVVESISLTEQNGGKKAVIEFDHPVEAVQAISLLNKQKLYDKEMDVAMVFSPARKLPEGLAGINKGLGPHGQPLKGVRTTIDLIPVYQKLKSDSSTTTSNNFDSQDLSNNTRPNNQLEPTNKPDIKTAIEALGAVLVALELIPPTVNCKDLVCIVEALKDNPNVKQYLESNRNNREPIQEEEVATERNDALVNPNAPPSENPSQSNELIQQIHNPTVPAVNDSVNTNIEFKSNNQIGAMLNPPVVEEALEQLKQVFNGFVQKLSVGNLLNTSQQLPNTNGPGELKNVQNIPNISDISRTAPNIEDNVNIDIPTCNSGVPPTIQALAKCSCNQDANTPASMPNANHNPAYISHIPITPLRKPNKPKHHRNESHCACTRGVQ